MKLTLLGTGTPAPSLKRQSSGYLLEIGDDVIVMDHGPGATHRLLESGHCPSDVTHLFLTHLHYDHIADYPRLLLQHWDQGAGKIPELKVYGPQPITRITEQLFGEGGVYGLDLEARVSHQASKDIYASRGGNPPRKKPNPQVTGITAGDTIEGEGWRLTVGAARHFQPYLECPTVGQACAVHRSGERRVQFGGSDEMWRRLRVPSPPVLPFPFQISIERSK